MVVVTFGLRPLFYIEDVPFGTQFGEGDAMKQKSAKRSAFSSHEGRAFSESRL